MADEAMAKVRCPVCGKGLRVEKKEVPGVVLCRACGNTFVAKGFESVEGVEEESAAAKSTEGPTAAAGDHTGGGAAQAAAVTTPAQLPNAANAVSDSLAKPELARDRSAVWNAIYTQSAATTTYDRLSASGDPAAAGPVSNDKPSNDKPPAAVDAASVLPATAPSGVLPLVTETIPATVVGGTTTISGDAANPRGGSWLLPPNQTSIGSAWPGLGATPPVPATYRYAAPKLMSASRPGPLPSPVPTSFGLPLSAGSQALSDGGSSTLQAIATAAGGDSATATSSVSEPVPGALPVEALPNPAAVADAANSSAPDAAASVDLTGVPLAEELSRRVARRLDRAVHRPHPIWWILLIGLLGAVAVFIAVIWTGQVGWFDTWERQARPGIVQMKSQAESLAAQGKWAEAHEQYRQIEQAVQGREVRDPELAGLIATARDDAKKVYAALLAEGQAQVLHRQAEAATLRADAVARQTEAMRQAAAAARGANSPDKADPTAVATGDMSGDGTAPGEGDAKGSSAGSQPARGGGEGTRPIAGTRSPEGPAGGSPIAGAENGGPPAVNPVAPSSPAPVALRHSRPLPMAESPNDGELTDDQIGLALERGSQYLLDQVDPTEGTVRSAKTRDESYNTGLDALVVYALLQAGEAMRDPQLGPRSERMRVMLEALKRMPIEGHHQTYARGLRSTCLALFSRNEDYKTLAADADWLIGTTDGGAYTYDGTYRTVGQRGLFASRDGSWDNSNSQYGLLGVWSAIEGEPRVEVPRAYWQAVERHWTQCQLDDGQWGYQGGTTGRLTMTCAGIASLFVAHEYLDPPMTSGTVGRDPFPPALAKALDWFEKDNNSTNVKGGNWWGYGLYGIERVGLASGFKHFGRHDWYRELASEIVRLQKRNGSWGDGAIDTAYAVLFLSRGRHPVMMSKLRFDGYWSNRPRDLANLSRFAGRQAEQPLNWQVVNAQNPWTDWLDSPILYIASHEAPNLTDEQIDKLRKFALSGGLIYTHADVGAEPFNQWARNLASRLFPQYPLQPLPQDHPFWSVLYKLADRPEVLGVSNGSRLLMVHSPTDLSLKWQQRIDRPFENRSLMPAQAGPASVINADLTVRNKILAPFQFGMNLFLYAAGKRDFRNRLNTNWVAESTRRPVDQVRIARLQYAGNWDPEPLSWVRYSAWLQRRTGTRLTIDPVGLADLQEDSSLKWPVAHLTGTTGVEFKPEEIEGLRRYVTGGGVVLVDAAGGMNGFDGAVREKLLPGAFPDRIPRLLDPQSHPLFKADAPGKDNCTKLLVRSYTLERVGNTVGTIQMLTPVELPSAKSGDRPSTGPTGAVIVASLDLTSGLLGVKTWGILGFDPDFATSFTKNLIFWTLDGQPSR